MTNSVRVTKHFKGCQIINTEGGRSGGFRDVPGGEKAQRPDLQFFKTGATKVTRSENTFSLTKRKSNIKVSI